MSTTYTVYTPDNKTQEIPIDDIFLIRSTPLRMVLELHHKGGNLKIRGKISRVALDVRTFFRAHTSYVVNITHIKNINEATNTLELTNGQTIPIAKRKIKVLHYLYTQLTDFPQDYNHDTPEAAFSM